MITNIDANGRVQLPLTIRYWLDLCPGDKIAVDQLGDGTIILKKIEGNEQMIESGRYGANASETAHG
jgi:AbrB family looped-hinge helix DNA binding protein